MAFTVMTWNVENLFRPGGDGPTTTETYQAKLHGLATVINAQAPDALSLQEIGDPAALDDLKALLDDDWPGRALGRPDSRGIRVAWLTRTPLGDPHDIVDFPAPLRPVQVDDTGTTWPPWDAVLWPSPSAPAPAPAVQSSLLPAI